MFEVFTFFTDIFQTPVLCHVTNDLAELLVPIDFLNFFFDFDSVLLHRTDASYIRFTNERGVLNIQKKVRVMHGYIRYLDSKSSEQSLPILTY